MQENNNTVIPQKNAQDQLHVKHMCIDKTGLLADEPIYWINFNTDIGNVLKLPCMSSF